MNLIQQIEAEEIAKAGKTIPEFRPGDTLRVGVKVIEGDRTRVQAYEGVCIARSNRGINSNFTVRKMSFGEGVERVFPLYSPNIDSIVVGQRSPRRQAHLLESAPLRRPVFQALFHHHAGGGRGDLVLQAVHGRHFDGFTRSDVEKPAQFRRTGVTMAIRCAILVVHTVRACTNTLNRRQK